jgi:predicted metal-dependent hydrolase
MPRREQRYKKSIKYEVMKVRFKVQKSVCGSKNKKGKIAWREFWSSGVKHINFKKLPIEK